MSLDQVSKIEKEILEFAELNEYSEQPLNTLSSGMHSRLSFSIASFVSPDILLLDEVFAAGDQGFKEKAKKKMHELIESSKILLFSSHEEALIKDICNSAIVLHKGRIKIKGSPEKAYDYYNEEILRVSKI